MFERKGELSIKVILILELDLALLIDLESIPARTHVGYFVGVLDGELLPLFIPGSQKD